MKLPLTAYVEPEIDAAVEKATRQMDESRSRYLRRLIFQDLLQRGFLSQEQLLLIAAEGNQVRTR